MLVYDILLFPNVGYGDPKNRYSGIQEFTTEVFQVKQNCMEFN